MYLEIYVDVLFAINFSFNYAVLWLVKKTRKQKSVLWRRMLASGIGSILVCVSVILKESFLFQYLGILQGALAIGMVLIAFQYTNKKNAIENIATFYIVSFFIGGFLNFLTYHTNFFFYLRELVDGKTTYHWKSVPLLIGAIVGMVLFLIWLYQWNEKKRREDILFPVELQFHERICRTQALLDTGNSLFDPISGSPVLIGEYEEVKTLFTESFQKAIETWMKQESIEEKIEIEDRERIRIIPYRSIGKEKGLLTGVVLDRVRVLSTEKEEVAEKEKVILAFYEGHLSNKNEYHIILHEAVMK